MEKTTKKLIEELIELLAGEWSAGANNMPGISNTCEQGAAERELRQLLAKHGVEVEE